MQRRPTGCQTNANATNLAETTRRSRGWLLAQQVLGKSVGAMSTDDYEARRSRAQLEWLGEFSPKHGRKLRRLLIEESSGHRPQERTIKFLDVPSLFKGEWDPSLHPRGGYPENLGWFSPAAWGTTALQGADPLSTTFDQFTLSPHTTALFRQHHADARGPEAIAWQDPSDRMPLDRGGHHWVNQATTEQLKKEGLLSKDAIKVFEHATKPTRFYSHAFDTWLGVTHKKYNEAILQITRKYIELVAPAGGLTGPQATSLVNWIKAGFPFSDEFGIPLKALGILRNGEVTGPLIVLARKWWRGFGQSVMLGETIWAERKGIKLTFEDVKIFCRRQINGEMHLPLSEAGMKMEKVIKSMGSKWARKLVVHGTQVLIGLGMLSSAVTGYAGQGAIKSGGAWGALNEVARDVMLADFVEPLAKAAGQSLYNKLIKPEHPPEDRHFRERPMLYDDMFKQEGLVPQSSKRREDR